MNARTIIEHILDENLIDAKKEKMYVCKSHFWHLYDPDSGDEYYCLNP